MWRSLTASTAPPSTRRRTRATCLGWYLDEDYDGDCFVDCQMFFDFKKKPSIKSTLKAEVDPLEWTSSARPLTHFTFAATIASR